MRIMNSFSACRIWGNGWDEAFCQLNFPQAIEYCIQNLSSRGRFQHFLPPLTCTCPIAISTLFHPLFPCLNWLAFSWICKICAFIHIEKSLVQLYGHWTFSLNLKKGKHHVTWYTHITDIHFRASIKIEDFLLNSAKSQRDCFPPLPLPCSSLRTCFLTGAKRFDAKEWVVASHGVSGGVGKGEIGQVSSQINWHDHHDLRLSNNFSVNGVCF